MTDKYNIDERLSFNVDFSSPLGTNRPDGFNEFGVKEYDDGSLGVIFSAMEPGVWKGMRITDEFLTGVAAGFSGPVPMQLDHSNGQLANVGQITDARFSDGFLKLRGHIPNTGNSVREDVIADFTYDPPAITDGSVGFSEDYEIVENEDGEPEFVDAELNEFSLTPFPAGYDDGGLSPAFAEAAKEAGVFETTKDKTESGTSRLKGRSVARFSEI